MEVEERTLTHEDSEEIKSDVKFSLTIDDEDEGAKKENTDPSASHEIDIWKELQEMSVTSPQGTLSYNTPHHNIPQSDVLFESDLGHDTIRSGVTQKEMSEKIEINTPGLVQDYLASLEDSTDPDNEEVDSVLDYTLYNDMVTIPELGTFKRRKHFSSLVTVQLIENMLSQSTTNLNSHLLIKASTVPGKLSESPHSTRVPTNQSCYKRPLNPHNTNTHTVSASQQQTRDPYKVDNKSTSQDPPHKMEDNTTEEERRSRLYNSLVHAQRRYAEKISTPTGPEYRFTKHEWESLGEELKVEDWEGGFLEPEEIYEKLNEGVAYQRHRVMRKENISSSSWKGKEKAVEESDEEEEPVTLIMKF